MKSTYTKNNNVAYTANVVAYIRSASVNNGHIAMQRQEILNYCRENNLFLEAEYIDNGFSGNNPDRPGIQQMFADATQNRQWTQVLVCEDSRLARDPDLFLKCEYKLTRLGIDLISIAPNYNTSNTNLIFGDIANLIKAYYEKNHALRK